MLRFFRQIRQWLLSIAHDNYRDRTENGFSKYLLYASEWILLICLSLGCERNFQVNSGYTIIQNIDVIDVVQGSLVKNQNIFIKDSLISGIYDEDSSPEFANATIIDGSGQYVMPGMWDMHFHLCWEKANDSLLFRPLLMHGITGVRDMGGDLSIQQRFKHLIKTDPTAGPEIYGAGPILDGDPPVFYDFTLPLGVDSNLEHLLDSIVSDGSDFIKTYSLLRESELIRISQYSISRNIPFAGHLSQHIDPEKSISLGQKSIEHLNRLDDLWVSDPPRVAEISRLMLENKTWLCPTLIVYYQKVHMGDSFNDKEQYNDYIHATLMKEWISSRERRLSSHDSSGQVEVHQKYDSQLQLVGFLHRKGVKLLAGSDFGGMPFVYPGIGLHEELSLLHQAGLTNAEVLATATINPARYLSLEGLYGSVAEGKIADLVILENSPLEDIKHIQSVVLVLRKGLIVRDTVPE